MTAIRVGIFPFRGSGNGRNRRETTNRSASLNVFRQLQLLAIAGSGLLAVSVRHTPALTTATRRSPFQTIQRSPKTYFANLSRLNRPSPA